MDVDDEVIAVLSDVADERWDKHATKTAALNTVEVIREGDIGTARKDRARIGDAKKRRNAGFDIVGESGA